VVWRSGRALVSTNDVNLRRSRLVLEWVTVSWYNSRCGTFSVCSQPPRSTQPGHLFVGRRNEYRPKGFDALPVSGSLTGKTVWSPYTQAISERFRDKGLIQSESKKLCPYTFVHNFDKCWSIFKILSLAC